MLPPREGGLGALLDTPCVPQAVIQTLEGPPGFDQLCLCPSCHHHSPSTKLDAPQEGPWEGKAAPRAPQQPGDQRAFPSPLKPTPGCRVCSAQGYIILQRRQLNSTAIYLWFPHDASGSAGEQGTDLRRRDKTQRVLKPHQRASPRAARESWGCSAG